MTDPLPKPEPDDDDDDLPIVSPVKVVELANGARRPKFSNEKINAALDKALAGVSPDAPAAFVATAWKEDGKLRTRMGVYIKHGDDLSFGGWIAGPVKRPLEEFGAEVRWTPRW